MSLTHWHSHFIDLSPVFEPFRPLAGDIETLSDWPTCQDLENLMQHVRQEVSTYSGAPVRFVSQENTANDAFEQQYEPRIYLTGEVATRPESWHDFFNALVWMTFPHAKAALNRIHYHALIHATHRNIEKRGPLRDASTLFDESGVIVLSSQKTLIELLQQHAWKKVFWEYRKTVLSSMRFMVFGHALHEKALNPYVGMTGKGIFFQVEEGFFREALVAQLQVVDRWLTDFLLQKLASNTDLSPIPVLGYPGWSDENAAADYYDNAQYFRPLVRTN
ncbi:MAG TPA: DUF3025 domain-containing protein [Nitrosomonas sp.]|nr:DUF3025 domain-containing protein [Nitrosomonas sp.]